MKRNLIFLIFTCLISSINSQEIGSLSIGIDMNESGFSFEDHTISQEGFYADFMIPIIKKTFVLSFKGQFTYHAIKSSSNYYSSKDYYVSGLNEILIGKSMIKKDIFYVFSAIGLGVYARSIYHPGPGITAAYIASSVNTYFMYDLENFDMGIAFTVNYLPVDGYFDVSNDVMFQLGIVIAK